MSQLLLSFCYTRPLGHVLARFDTSSQAFEWLDLTQLNLPIYGATGVCRHAGGFYAVLQVKCGNQVSTELVEFDNECRVRRNCTLHQVHDAHSMVIWKDTLLVVSTGSNQVIEITWPADCLAEERVFFELEPGADTLHMNGLQVFEDHIYLSMFGQKPGPSWITARHGCVLDLTQAGQTVVQDLHHPHALFVDGDALGCLSSMTGHIAHIAGEPQTAYPVLPGYIRGAASDARHLYIGVSIPRQHSKSRGVTHEAPGSMTDGRGCGLHQFDKLTGQTTWLDLSPFGSELYDIVIWPEATPIQGSREQAMAERLYAMNAEVSEQMNNWYQLISARKQMVDAIAELVELDGDYVGAKRLLVRLLSQAPQCAEWNYYYAVCEFALGGDLAVTIRHMSNALEGNFKAESARAYLKQAYLAPDPTGQAARLPLTTAESALASSGLQTPIRSSGMQSATNQ